MSLKIHLAFLTIYGLNLPLATWVALFFVYNQPIMTYT